jgi:hypothetical protein
MAVIGVRFRCERCGHGAAVSASGGDGPRGTVPLPEAFDRYAAVHAVQAPGCGAGHDEFVGEEEGAA